MIRRACDLFEMSVAVNTEIGLTFAINSNDVRLSFIEFVHNFA